MKKLLNLVWIMKDDQVLLGMKKRGFGAGWWNGFGGKVQDGESVEQSAIREVQEEVGITVNKLLPRGVLNFSFDDDDKILEVHLFEVRDFTGEATESEEMLPQWYKFSELPFGKMWADDKYWVPHFLAGKEIKGNFHFDKDKQVKTYNLEGIN